MKQCPIHGLQFAAYVCEHVGNAIRAGAPKVVYVRKGPYEFRTVCQACESSEQAVAAAEHFTCEVCIREWAEGTGNVCYLKHRAEAGEAGPFSPSAGTLPTRS